MEYSDIRFFRQQKRMSLWSVFIRGQIGRHNKCAFKFFSSTNPTDSFATLRSDEFTSSACFFFFQVLVFHVIWNFYAQTEHTKWSPNLDQDDACKRDCGVRWHSGENNNKNRKSQTAGGFSVPHPPWSVRCTSYSVQIQNGKFSLLFCFFSSYFLCVLSAYFVWLWIELSEKSE